MKGDLLLLNGKVLTMDSDNPIATALAIRGGKIAIAGTDAEAREAAGPRVQTIDLAGRSVTPALNDAHAHPMSLGFSLADVKLSQPEVYSIVDIQRAVAERASQTPEDQWIKGRSYDQARLN